tara:strand:+ start:1136 stop:1306 length:171 start_codon:yes stop_codon:yes gene_type:complete
MQEESTGGSGRSVEWTAKRPSMAREFEWILQRRQNMWAESGNWNPSKDSRLLDIRE